MKSTISNIITKTANFLDNQEEIGKYKDIAPRMEYPPITSQQINDKDLKSNSNFEKNQSVEIDANTYNPINNASYISIINAHNRNKRLNIMVLGAAFGLIFCLIMLTSYKGDLPGEVIGIISTISGIFGACLKDAYSFEFGSSRGSKEKDDKFQNYINNNVLKNKNNNK